MVLPTYTSNHVYVARPQHSTCDISMLGSSILSGPHESRRGWMCMRVCVGSTCDISMLGSSILPAMNEAWLDVYACLCG